MAIAQITSGVTLDEYQREQRLLAEHGESFPGRLLQVCFGDPDNLTILTVYESVEDRNAFSATVLSPILDKLGIEVAGRPGFGNRVEEVHKVMVDPVQCVQAPVRALLDQAPTAVRRFVGALNAGDTERLLGFFPDGVRLLDAGKVFSGRDQVREFSDRELIGVHGYFDVRQVTRDGETVVVAGPYHSGRYNGPARFVFTVRDGKITELSLESDPEPAWLS